VQSQPELDDDVEVPDAAPPCPLEVEPVLEEAVDPPPELELPSPSHPLGSLAHTLYIESQ
jgi:hypothetical protein